MKPSVIAISLAALLLPQIALVAAAQSRPDRAFGFSMFPESSWVQCALFWRAPNGKEMPLHAGCFQGGPCISEVTRRRDLQIFGERFVAPYGQAAVLHRMQIAMHAFALHVPTHNGALVLRATHATNLRPEAHAEHVVQVVP